MAAVPKIFRTPTRTGVIAYRQDLFDRHNLGIDSWTELIGSLRFLKTTYPESYPLGGSFDDLLYHFPTWWGSGLDPENILYFDPDRQTWTLGLAEPEFRDAILQLAELWQDGIIHPDAFTMEQADLRRHLSSDSIFVAPYPGPTGPSFPYAGTGYGELGSDGEWDGEGAWIAAMPLPESPAGEPTRYSARILDVSNGGWLVYNQSEHVGEAIALLDLLYRSDVAMNLRLGAEGTVWRSEGDGSVLLPPFDSAYRGGWLDGLETELSRAGLAVDSPLVGVSPDMIALFGPPDVPGVRYYLSHDMQQNRPGLDLLLQPGVRIPDQRDFREQRAEILVTLQTEIESTIARIVVGQKPISDLDQLLTEMDKHCDALVSLYNEWCIVPDRELLTGR